MDENNEDSWLYGTSNPDSTTNEDQIDEKPEIQEKPGKIEDGAVQDPSIGVGGSAEEASQEDMGDFEDPAEEMEEDELATAAADTTDAEGGAAHGEEEKEQPQPQQSKESDSDDDDDDSDDDINVVIGDIKTATSTYNIKQRGNLLAAGQIGGEKSKGAAQGGKFTIEDFEGVGTINGVAAHEFSIDSLEDKPWRKPGADITDYFNYGFNEETWRSYCERQKRFRVVESGVGLASLTQSLNQSMDRHADHGQPGLLPPPGSSAGGLSGMGDQMQGQSQGMMPPPMGHHHHGNLQRIPLGPRPSRPMNNSGGSVGGQSKENAIQVMTAECREYSRPGQLASSFSGPPPGDEPFFPEPDPFDYGYEPTQESQWGNNDNPGWVPTGIKELTPGPTLVQPPQMGGPPGVPPPQQMAAPPQMRGPPPQMMGGMPPNMPMGPPPPHVMGPMMMGPTSGPVRMPIMNMMPPQQHGPQMPPKMEHLDERPRSPTRRNRSRSRERSRRRSKSPIRQRRSSPTRRSRRSRSSSKVRKVKSTSSRRSRSRSGSKSRSKSSRTHRSRSRSQSKTKRPRRSHSRSKSPKTGSSSTSSSKKRSEKVEK